MLYMLRPGVSERIEKFVHDGGTFVTTYCSGMVNESDLCFLGGFPGPLRKVLGIWAEETDGLHDEDENSVTLVHKGLSIGSKEYQVKEICDLIHCETAETIGTYNHDFYAGRPALTVNTFGSGKAYYIAFRNNLDFENDFYAGIIQDLKVLKALDAELPKGVTAQLRTDGERDFIFVMNFSANEQVIELKNDSSYKDLLADVIITGNLTLQGFGVKALERLRLDKATN